MTLRLRVLPRFPARISGISGISTYRDGPDLVIKSDYGALVRIPAVANEATTFFKVWDADDDSYSIMTFEDMFAAVVDIAGLMAVATYDPQGKGADAFARANHTGVQAISTITGLQAALDTKVSSAGLRNLIINGSFRINQRVFAGGALAAGVYGHDRWKADTGGCNYSVSGGVATISSGNLVQIVPGANIEVSGVYTISWTGTATCTVNGNAVTNGANVNLTAGTNSTIKFTGGTVTNVQLEYGTLATSFEHIPFELLEQICQRYYEKSYNAATAPGTNTGYGFGCYSGSALLTSNFYDLGKVFFKVRKRAVPSISLWSTNGVAGQFFDNNAGGNSGNSGVQLNSEIMFSLLCPNNALTVNHSYGSHWAAEAEL